MTLRLVSIGKDGILRLSLEGSVASEEIRPDAVHPFAAVIGDDWAANRAVLSLQQTGYLDSSGIGWLMTVHRTFKQAGGRLVLHSISPPVRQLLELLRLQKLFQIASDEAGAVELAQEVPA